MFLINPIQVAINYLDYNIVSMTSRLTKVSRRTIEDALSKKRTMRLETIEQVRNDFQVWLEKYKELSEEVAEFAKSLKQPAPREPDTYLENHPWYDQLYFEQEAYHRYCRRNNRPCVELLPKASMEELKRVEVISTSFASAYENDDLVEAKRLIVENWNISLLNRFIHEPPVIIELLSTWDALWLRLCRIHHYSLLYVFAIIDAGLAVDGQSAFADLIPIKCGDKWHLPIRMWVSEIQSRLGFTGVDEMGLQLSGWLKTEAGKGANGIRYVKRWRAGKHIPSWKHAVLICARVNPGENWRYTQDYLRYIIARVLQLYHNDCRAKYGFTDVAFISMYSNYNSFFEYHLKLKQMTPAQDTCAEAVEL